MSLPTLPTHPKPSLVEGKYMDIKARCAKREVRKAQSEEATLLMDQLGHEFNSDDFILDFVGIRGMQDGRWVPLMGLYSTMRSCEIKQYAKVLAGKCLEDSNSILTSTGPDFIFSFCFEQSITMSGATVANSSLVNMGSARFP
ncbi:hypothetical protein PV326_007039 [Microctonus aethiopoides]|nr:hypothetical protein PV326_007039 [Microctonus aethiopoides]